MPSAYAIVAIMIALTALVSFAFMTQAVQAKKAREQRAISVLMSKSRFLHFILEGCPSGYLPKELEALVLASLIDTTSQLARLAPNENKHQLNLDVAKNMMANNALRDKCGDFPPHTEIRDLKSTKASLAALNKFVYRLESQDKLHKTIAGSYRLQIKQVLLRISFDQYLDQGDKAEQTNKPELAKHHYTAAVSLIENAGEQRFFDDQLTELKEKIAQLNELVATKQDQPSSDENALSSEWDKFDDDPWQKQSVYD